MSYGILTYNSFSTRIKNIEPVRIHIYLFFYVSPFSLIPSSSRVTTPHYILQHCCLHTLIYDVINEAQSPEENLRAIPLSIC